MTDLRVDRTQGGEPASADAAYLVVTDSTGTEIISSTLVEPSDTGVYTYTTVYLSAGTYTATWTFQVTGQDDEVVSRVFEVDTPVTLVSGVTLADLERRLARFVGPHRKFKAYTGSTTSSALVRSLRSSLDSGDYEDMHLLRRGVMSSGALIPNFDESDRHRQVAEFNAALGALTPDSNWTNSPINNEEFELHYLDPQHELRPVLLEGLRRCYFWDRAEILVTAPSMAVDITTEVPWITDPKQIQGVETTAPGNANLVPSERMLWFKPFISSGKVYLQTSYLGSGSLYITALRPHFTYVNGETTMAGPSSDSDVLNVDPLYAAMAGVVQAWIELTDRLEPLSKQNLRLTREQAAGYFTEKSRQVANEQPEFMKIRWESEARDFTQVGNA